MVLLWPRFDQQDQHRRSLEHMQRGTRLPPLFEIAAMATLLTSYIWLWGGTFEGSFKLCVVLYLGVGVAAHLRARESLSDIGLRLDTILPAGRAALLATVAIGGLLVGAGTLLGSLEFPPAHSLPRALWDGIVWGTLQQYGLLAIFYRRFSELLPGRRRPLLAASAVFGLLHVPNPFLIAATFGAGTLSCWIYRRSPN